MTLRRILGATVLVLAATFSTAEDDVLRIANWLVGSFDKRAQFETNREAGLVRMVGRPIQDPVVFDDGIYMYLELRFANEDGPYRQRVFKLRKGGRRLRLEAFRIDPQLLIPLSSEPQMLSQLAPGDLTRESGCDITLERRGDGYEGGTDLRACRSDWRGSSYMTSTMRITSELVVILDRAYDDRGVQTFGPAKGDGHEFRRTAP